MKSLVELYHRFSQLIHELFKFGTIGVLASIVTLAVSNLLWHFVGLGPLTGSVIATVIATVIAFLGNRFWTFRHRDRTGLAREYFLFFVFNGIGLLIQLLCLGFTVYTLKLDGFWARNISNNVIGLGLGTLFRYWSYRKWVFLPPSEPAVDPHTGLPEADDAGRPHAADGTTPVNGELRARLNGHPVAPGPEVTPDR